MKLYVALALLCAVAAATAVPRGIHADLARLQRDLHMLRGDDSLQSALAVGDDGQIITDIANNAINSHCIMKLAMLFDRSGSINDVAIGPYVDRLLQVVYKSVLKIKTTLDGQGLPKSKVGLWGFSAAIKYWSKGPETFYQCLKGNHHGAASKDPSCRSNTATREALEGLFKEHPTIGTVLLVTDGKANVNSDPQAYIKRLRTDGKGVIIVYVGKSEDDAAKIEKYAAINDNKSSGFFKVIVGKEDTPDAGAIAKKILSTVCVSARPMIAHFKTGVSALSGGKCNKWPEQAKEVSSIKESLKRASCNLPESKVYVIGRFSGAASTSNKNFGIARAKSVRAAISKANGISADKFVIGWGMAGEGSKEGDCEQQRVDVFCGGVTAVDIPPELAWEQVKG